MLNEEKLDPWDPKMAGTGYKGYKESTVLVFFKTPFITAIRNRTWTQ